MFPKEYGDKGADQPLGGVVAQDSRGTLTELDGAGRVHPEPHGNDGLKVVVLHIAGNLSRTLQSNYPEFPDGCLPELLAVLVDVAHVPLFFGGRR